MAHWTDDIPLAQFEIIHGSSVIEVTHNRENPSEDLVTVVIGDEKFIIERGLLRILAGRGILADRGTVQENFADDK